jgi:hydroxyacylglutathione hydrolase
LPGLVIHCGLPDSPGQVRHGEATSHPVVQIGNLSVTSSRVQGHAEDGMIYKVTGWPDGVPLVAFLGDTLFAGSVARGFISFDLLKREIHEQILTLPPDTLLCPGHGPVTTVAEEKANNPFF